MLRRCAGCELGCCWRQTEPRPLPTGKFSMRGSLEEGARPRLYHSVAILLPDCRVLVGGSDTTNDHTAEIFSPPYLQRGPRPVLAAAPSFIRVGETIEAQFSSADPVDRAILIRTGAVTHSVAFGAWGGGSAAGAGIAWPLWLRLVLVTGACLKPPPACDPACMQTRGRCGSPSCPTRMARSSWRRPACPTCWCPACEHCAAGAQRARHHGRPPCCARCGGSGGSRVHITSATPAAAPAGTCSSCCPPRACPARPRPFPCWAGSK